MEKRTDIRDRHLRMMIAKLDFKSRRRTFRFDYGGPPWAFLALAFVVAFVLLSLLS